jgi:hypothetical protein
VQQGFLVFLEVLVEVVVVVDVDLLAAGGYSCPALLVLLMDVEVNLLLAALALKMVGA